jgi:hypothetical protein
MIALDKYFAQYADDSLLLDTDRWQLALRNGHALSVSAMREDQFLLLDAETGMSPAPDRLLPLAESLASLPASLKFALCPEASTVRLRAEFPLAEESVAADRVRRNLDGMRIAADRLHELVSSKATGVPPACLCSADSGPAVPGSPTDLIEEAGWTCHERSGGSLLADLETGGQFCQAELETFGGSLRFRVTLCRDAEGEAVCEALSLYLLKANAARRIARGFVEHEAGGIAAGFEVLLEGSPVPTEAGHALAALSVAARYCAKEMEVLKDAALAGFYRSAIGDASHLNTKRSSNHG